MNHDLTRILPNSEQSEKAAIGAMLIDPATALFVAEKLSVDDFYYAAHKIIYREIVEMMGDQIALDPILINQRLQDAGLIDSVGGAVAVLDCMGQCPSPNLADNYVQIIAEKSMQRRVIEHCHNLIQKAHESEDPANLATSAAESFAKIHDSSAHAFGSEKATGFKSMRELETEFSEFVTKAHPRTLDLRGWLPNLSRKAKLTTLVPGEMLVLVGDTGTGKSAFMQNLARCVSPHPVAFFSMELPGTKMFRRFVQIDQDMESDEVWQTYRNGQKVDWSADRLGNIWVCEESGLTIEGIQHRIRALAKKLGVPPTLTVIDYMQLVQGKGKRYERTSDSAEGLKVLAKQERTIVAVLSQVQRPEDKSTSADPGLHSGKDSGSIENSAGLHLAIRRDPLNQKDKTRMRITVCKQTDGEAGAWQDCRLDGPKLRITEINEPMATKLDWTTQAQ